MPLALAESSWQKVYPVESWPGAVFAVTVGMPENAVENEIEYFPAEILEEL